MCPPCAWLQIERWLVPQKARLFACAHDQVICTIPSERHDLWLANVAVMTHLLVACVRDTWLELRGDPTSLGATPGILATWHTWTQTLRLHPPIHALVTGGGLTNTGRWVPVRHGFLLPKLGRAKWNVPICERSPHGTGVLIDLARDVRGGPLAKQRLVSSAHGEVTFRYRVNGEASDRRPRGLMTLPIAEFIGRYRLHVPAPGTRVVRS